MSTSSPSIGVAVAHLFWSPSILADADAALAAIAEMSSGDDQVVCASMLGHKADLATMVLSSDQWRIRRFQTTFADAGFELVDSYISLTEMSEYAQGLPEEMKQARLHPQLPPEGKPAFCFYPMSKRRNVGQNWFTLPYDDRKALMMEHGSSGRKFAGRVLQVVTGSTGLDDFEWGVTLFCQHPDDVKEVVYTMRYDEASATYAEFGTFYVGMVAEPAEALASIGVG
ncbi:MAG: chlorite dismutase family protein [Acidimicrobiales bacterium]